MESVDGDTPIFCAITLWLGVFIYWMSISIFCFMSVHLLVVIRRMEFPNAGMQPKTAHRVLLGMWLVSILVWSGVLIPVVYMIYQNHTDRNSCILQPNKYTIPSNLAASSIFYAVWLIIIVINLTSVILLRAKIKLSTGYIVPAISMPNMVRSSTFMSAKVRKFKDSLVIVGVTSVVSTICILPAVAITTGTMLSADAEEGRSKTHRPVSFILIFINSCSNIFIYYWRINNVRESLKSMFCNRTKFSMFSIFTKWHSSRIEPS